MKKIREEEHGPRVRINDAVLDGADGGLWELVGSQELLGDQDPEYVPLTELQAARAAERKLRQKAEAELELLKKAVKAMAEGKGEK